MTIQCADCQNFDLQSAGKNWAVIGFGECKVIRGAYKAARYARECASFAEAPAETATKRREWLESKVDG